MCVFPGMVLWFNMQQCHLMAPESQVLPLFYMFFSWPHGFPQGSLVFSHLKAGGLDAPKVWISVWMCACRMLCNVLMANPSCIPASYPVFWGQTLDPPQTWPGRSSSWQWVSVLLGFVLLFWVCEKVPYCIFLQTGCFFYPSAYGMHKNWNKQINCAGKSSLISSIKG